MTATVYAGVAWQVSLWPPRLPLPDARDRPLSRGCSFCTPREPPVSERALRAKLATEYRRRDRDPDRIAAARRDLAAQQIHDHITRILGAAPPLTADQRLELASLLVGGDGVGTAA